MTHGTGDDVGVALKVIVVFFELPRHRRECAHDVLRDRRFFGNHEGFAHFKVP